MAEQSFVYAIVFGFFIALTIILFAARKIRYSKQVRTSSNTEQKKPSGNPSVLVTRPRKISRYNKALSNYSEDIFVKSIVTINDFSKSMITLVSGLFAVYFALLKFLGIEEMDSQTVSNLVVFPPIFFIISLIAFIFTTLPLANKISFEYPKIIANMRERIFMIKYIAVIIGIFWLVLSMLLTIYIFLNALNINPHVSSQ